MVKELIHIYNGDELEGVEGAISDYTVNDGYYVYAYAGGTADGTVVKGGGTFVVDGGTATDTTVRMYGIMQVDAGEVSGISIRAFSTLTLNSAVSDIKVMGGTMTVKSGGIAEQVTISTDSTVSVEGGGLLQNATLNNATVLLEGGTAQQMYMQNGSSMTVGDNGIASEIKLGTSGTLITVQSGGTLEKVNCVGGTVSVAAGAVAVNSRVSGYTKDEEEERYCGSMVLEAGAVHKGTLTIVDGYATVTAKSGSLIDFTIAECTPENSALIDNFAGIQGAPSFTLTVSDEQESGHYCLADKVADFTYTITVQDTEGQQLGELSLASVLEREEGIYALSLEDGQLCLTVTRNSLYALSGDADGISWKGKGELFNVQYSQDGFEHVLSLESTEKAIDTFALPEGTYQWRVQEADDVAWVLGEDITATAQEAEASSWSSVSNGAQDIFFASGKGTWNSAYKAQHVGTLNGWEGGTGEEVVLAGKNRIADTFTGSEDANILMLTDDANGDALFVDDIYTAFPDKKQSRIAQLDEICSGAGDDLVDMTSQRFTYQGDGLIIRGGDGNDTIWASGGSNTLLGDSGDDRLVGASGNDVLAGGAGDDSLHGGGGNDIFCFCEEWGDDTIEQLAGADNSVTLWFKESSDELNLTFTMEGDDTVITAASGDTITALGMTLTAADCRFGDGSSTRAVVVVSEDYSRLSALGAFDASSSTCIFAEA